MKSKMILYISIVFIIILGNCNNKENNSNQKNKISQTLHQEIEEYIKQGAIVIDVRTPEEYQTGHLKNSFNIPYDQIEQHLKELEKYKDKTIILYCRSGRRSGIAKNILEMNGFRNVVNGINLSYFPKDLIEK
ncbi:MAG: rhodanese-like domain-containing protein [Leptonema sp. (in: bacteria)]